MIQKELNLMFVKSQKTRIKNLKTREIHIVEIGKNS